MCVLGFETIEPEPFLTPTPCTIQIFFLPLHTKRTTKPEQSTPLIITIWFSSTYRGGLPTSASSVNAMCGESRHSCNSFLTNLESFFLRHCQERRRNQGLQQSRDTAIIASCKATVWKNTNRASHSCELMDTMWRSALWWRQRNWRKGMKTLPFPARGLSIVIKVSDAFTLADFEVYGLTNKRE